MSRILIRNVNTALLKPVLVHGIIVLGQHRPLRRRLASVAHMYGMDQVCLYRSFEARGSDCELNRPWILTER